MILIGIGANLPAQGFATPRDTCEAALVRLAEGGAVRVLRCSTWRRTAPVPKSDQPWYVNGVAILETSLNPMALLDHLLATERSFGRVRTVPNAARVLDLDLLAYDDHRLDGPAPLILPHPRMVERAFVMLPLAEVAPAWRHPLSGEVASEIAARFSGAPGIELLA
ncbi:2-amino-4-hydroxy-6-hydroxymethyldihydropteridinepyrophosphokinase [Magnetospira sp. QH-2]|nr:2-amino-4-hydroxy-6-hydroxymethyldihydropteridinepyrophosphokinase [Magnetospira sp. QH-2]